MRKDWSQNNLNDIKKLITELTAVEKIISSLYRTFAHLFEEDNNAMQFWEKLSQAKENRASFMEMIDFSNIKKENTSMPFPISAMVEHLNMIKRDVVEKKISHEGAICLAIGIECSLKERFQLLGIDEGKNKDSIGNSPPTEDEIIDSLTDFARQYRLPYFKRKDVKE